MLMSGGLLVKMSPSFKFKIYLHDVNINIMGTV